LQELLVLEKEGMVIETRTKSFRVKASLLNVGGDIPGVAELCLHAGHNSYSGCRMCKIKGVYSRKKKTVVFPATKEAQNFVQQPLRSIEDYQNSDLVMY
jgi:hypothetical protein